ncbi:MAG: siphovirus Gp157 family protein [Xenococcaceae cyanobacterium]
MDKTEIRTKLRQVNEILDSLESKEISPALEAVLNDLFFQEDGIETNSQSAFENIIAIIDYIQARIKVMEQRAKNLFQIIETDTNTVGCLERYLIKCLRDREIDRLKTQDYDLQIVSDSSQRELVVKEGVSIADVPEEYQKLFLEIDYSSVRKTLESGEKLDFASLSEPELHLSVHKRSKT